MEELNYEDEIDLNLNLLSNNYFELSTIPELNLQSNFINTYSNLLKLDLEIENNLQTDLMKVNSFLLDLETEKINTNIFDILN